MLPLNHRRLPCAAPAQRVRVADEPIVGLDDDLLEGDYLASRRR
jgi:hypothetical protein